MLAGTTVGLLAGATDCILAVAAAGILPGVTHGIVVVTDGVLAIELLDTGLCS